MTFEQSDKVKYNNRFSINNANEKIVEQYL